MKKVFLFLIINFIIIKSVIAFQCNECHSKNPKMVKMHQALGMKDCFKCHGFKGKKSKEELKAQMITDDKCIGCHLKK